MEAEAASLQAMEPEVLYDVVAQGNAEDGRQLGKKARLALMVAGTMAIAAACATWAGGGGDFDSTPSQNYTVDDVVMLTGVNDLSCNTPEDCQTDDCNTKGFINHGCVHKKCYHGTPDAKCHGVANGQQYVSMPPNTWCWDGRLDKACAIHKVSENKGYCTSPDDCMTDDCNKDTNHGFKNYGCVYGKCYHGIPDARCKGVDNTQRYHSQQIHPWTWCFNGNRDSQCQSKKLTLPAGMCASMDDCQTPACNKDANNGYRNYGCVKGKCYHGIPDARCKGVQNTKRYHGQEANTWCFNGNRDSAC